MLIAFYANTVQCVEWKCGQRCIYTMQTDTFPHANTFDNSFVFHFFFPAYIQHCRLQTYTKDLFPPYSYDNQGTTNNHTKQSKYVSYSLVFGMSIISIIWGKMKIHTFSTFDSICLAAFEMWRRFKSKQKWFQPGFWNEDLNESHALTHKKCAVLI